jgi:hypothetical protein
MVSVAWKSWENITRIYGKTTNSTQRNSPSGVAIKRLRTCDNLSRFFGPITSHHSGFSLCWKKPAGTSPQQEGRTGRISTSAMCFVCRQIKYCQCHSLPRLWFKVVCEGSHLTMVANSIKLITGNSYPQLAKLVAER